MANFSGTMITNKGLNLLAKAINGTNLTFTRMALGDGFWQENINPVELDALISEKFNIQIQGIELTGTGTARMRGVVTNNMIQAGFFARELGIFAQDPEIGEILYAVSYSGEQADYIPPTGNVFLESVIDAYVVIDRAENVTAVIDDTVVLATKKDIIEHNESLSSHQNIQVLIDDHKKSSSEHQIPEQIQYAITHHDHINYTKRYIHFQQASAIEWSILHNLNTGYPIVQAYQEDTEQINLDGYCGSGAYCGQSGLYCGGGIAINALKLTDIPYSAILIISQNKLLLRFSYPQQGKAIILGGVS
ncbi:phage tail protein [Thermodesulfovibrio thiophilus]|uniref:phage tail-collar fiber domain-containing protein n=1 Tax=Thermodesulfovibrio thiophilus TaxID=340095 RepID=UPI0003F69E6D|nr:phage tail protein [Thermodesulfovibrio thiophilus]